MVQNILIGLPYGVRYHFVANRSTIDKEVLQISLTSRNRRQTHPAPETNTGTIIVHIQGVFHKCWATDICHPLFLLRLTASRA